MPLRQSHIRALEPYLEPGGPSHENKEGHPEWDMVCPLHDDKKRSASIDTVTGKWWCFAGCGGGRISELIRRKSEWVPPTAATRSSNGSANHKSHESEVITEAMIDGWSESLASDLDSSLDWMAGYRGLHMPILKLYRIGWDRDRKVYTIPVYDKNNLLVSLRRYNPRPREDRRKMWGVSGMNAPHLYPLDQLEYDDIIICGGEWDALATIQAGYAAITRTAAERVWSGEWNECFVGKKVFVCHDMDDTGQSANRKVVRALRNVAEEVRVVTLPYRVERKHGKDLSDFWNDFNTGDFDALLDTAVRPSRSDASDKATEGEELETITVLDSFDSSRVGKPVRLLVTIKGKKEPGYSVPDAAELSCTQDAGTKCAYCPLNAVGGTAEVKIRPDDPAILEMIESTQLQLHDIVRRVYGAQKCNRLEIETHGHQAVEVLYARPSIDHAQHTTDDYKNIKLTSVGRHDTSPNNTVAAEGALYPNPRSQANEFQAWQVDPLSTSIDNFEYSKDLHNSLRRFQPGRNESPLEKLMLISDDLSSHVTKIYGRPEMHAMMDLVWHSALEFRFRDEVVGRGWLEGLVLGDTRTGKSEAAGLLARFYGAGELVNCEAASFAGVVGGLQQFGSGREWAVTWGAIPLNDRRLVVLDEVSGLSPEAISQMSDIRSSGIAKLTKIQSEVTPARTRLLWLSNPRKASMANFTWGVQAIPPLIGNMEDIARFDIVCAVARGDVASEEINRAHKSGEMPYTSEMCSTLVRWVWTRTGGHIRWERGAEQTVYKAALDLGQRYVEDPPLLQAANARIKVARIACALALRLYSTEDGEHVLVTKQHVQDAVRFIDMLYTMPTLGYAEKSAEAIADRARAARNTDKARKYLRTRRGLLPFLRGNNSFRRQDLEEVLNMSREEANSVINSLWEMRMIRKEYGNVLIEPALHALMRSKG